MYLREGSPMLRVENQREKKRKQWQ